MLVFFDESGDSGMKRKAGSSRLFIVTAVLFEENAEAETCDFKIADLKRRLGLRENFEFHFNSCSDHFRRSFFETITASEFFYHSVVLNKSKLWGEGFKEKNSFYKYAAGLVFENARSNLSQAKVVIDKCGNRDFRRELSKYLQRRMNEGNQVLIRKISMEPSHSNNLLQLADMVCGAVSRSFDTEKANRFEFRRIVNHRELRVQVWPR